MSIDNKRTKIVCTIGPASSSKEIMKEIMNAGMNVARVNFSHGEYSAHEATIKNLREAADELNRYIGILGDLKGPKIRVGKFENHHEEYKAGEEIDVYLNEIMGTHERFSILQKELFEDVKVGDKLSIDDGKVIVEILECSKEHMKIKTLNDGIISSNKGINAPGVILTMPFVSEKDYNDLLFMIEHKVNYVASSFVRRAQDVKDIRKILDEHGGSDIGIIAKIENQEGVDNIESIIKVADGIMVARGDMGVEVPLELVPVYQKKIIKLCNEAGKPVITATHMLESMIHCPRPTRAEASDVANAVLDGSDAVMLSGECAVGEYPVLAVETMSKIITEAEQIINYSKRNHNLVGYSDMDINDAIGISVASSAFTIKNAKAIFAFTDTGGTARRISHYRPCLPIVACTSIKRTCEKVQLYWGVYSVLVRDADNFREHDKITREESIKFGFKDEDVVIMTSGLGVAHGQTNTIRLLKVGE